jgi:putative RecB family exonuclease
MSRVSPLKVRVFQQCRLRFRYQYVDKDATRARPRLRPADTAGSLVHRVLCDFFTKTGPAERTRDHLLQMFDDGWGALSPGYHRVPGVGVHYDNSVRQLQNFAEHFDLAAVPLMVEPYFQFEIESGTTVFGRLDRVDEEPDGSLHIIDYKTGAMTGDVDPSQLVFYAILVEQEVQRTVSRASFWYLDDATTWTMDFTEEDKRDARTGLLASIREMESVSEYPPTIGDHCPSCPYFKPCDFHDEIVSRIPLPGGQALA